MKKPQSMKQLRDMKKGRKLSSEEVYKKRMEEKMSMENRELKRMYGFQLPGTDKSGGRQMSESAKRMLADLAQKKAKKEAKAQAKKEEAAKRAAAKAKLTQGQQPHGWIGAPPPPPAPGMGPPSLQPLQHLSSIPANAPTSTTGSWPSDSGSFWGGSDKKDGW